MNPLVEKLGRFLSVSVPSPKVPTLGDRELEVMKILWQGKPLSAKQVLHSIHDQELSLSTMQSTLERLCRKKLLHREKAGRYFVYQAAVTRAQIISQLLGEITDQICDGDVAPLVSGFTDFYSGKSSNPDLEALSESEKQAILPRDLSDPSNDESAN